MNGIEICGIEKSYGGTRALKGVSFAVEPGKIYGLLGRNGAGKTTLLNIVAGRLYPDGGEVKIDGRNPFQSDEALCTLHMMGEKNLFPSGMRVKEGIRWASEFLPAFDQNRAYVLAEKFSLPLRTKIKSLSTGYGSIFKIVLALSSNARYLLLDEPVLGLDANHRDLFYRLLLEDFSEKGRGVVISTHIIEEVQHLVEQVIILHEGEILRNADTETLMRGSYSITGPAGAVDAFAKGREVLGNDVLGGIKTVYLTGEAPQGELPGNLELGKPDLKRMFIKLTGGKEEN
ncbi:MAG TPA: ABC transporter ATP-binding protein [Clostridia bacterium]|nr:ABC transporter ATP-binding protein [Clostridia bacterium]